MDLIVAILRVALSHRLILPEFGQVRRFDALVSYQDLILSVMLTE